MDLHSPKEGRKHPCGFLNQPILLFKFTYLTQQLIDEYIYFLGKSDTNTGAPDYICLPAYACMYPLLTTALSQVDPEEPPEDGLCPVLICLCLTNWQGFDGFRLSQPYYSSTPLRDEFVLCEGFRFHVLKIDEVEEMGGF